MTAWKWEPEYFHYSLQTTKQNKSIVGRYYIVNSKHILSIIISEMGETGTREIICNYESHLQTTEQKRYAISFLQQYNIPLPAPLANIKVNKPHYAKKTKKINKKSIYV
jgi:hypothetical protein